MHSLHADPTRKKNDKDPPVTSTKEPRFLVHIAHRAEISTEDFKISVLSDIVLCHLEYAEMKVSDWTERTTCHQNDGSFVWIANDCGKAMVWKGVVWRTCEFFCEVDGRRSHWVRRSKKCQGRSRKQLEVIILY